MADREKGTVKWFNKIKGYGFIRWDNGTDIFVYHTSIKDAHLIHEGSRVEFMVIQGKKGLQADDVTVLD